MANRRIFVSNSDSFKNPVIDGLRILGILADFRIRVADFFSRIFTEAFLLIVATTAVIF